MMIILVDGYFAVISGCASLGTYMPASGCTPEGVEEVALRLVAFFTSSPLISTMAIATARKTRAHEVLTLSIFIGLPSRMMERSLALAFHLQGMKSLYI